MPKSQTRCLASHSTSLLVGSRGRPLAALLREHSVDAVCGPLEGGAFLAYAVADLLGVAFLAGYRLPGERARYRLPAVPGAVAALVSLGEASTTVQARMGVPFYPASTVPSRAWPAERCPLCAEGAPFTDPLSGNVVTPLPARRPLPPDTASPPG